MVKRTLKDAEMLWDSGLEKLGQQWNQVWSAVEFYDAFGGPDGTLCLICLHIFMM